MDSSELNKKAHEQFLKWLARTLVGGILAVLAVVVVIDPYNIYGLFVFDGINTVKPELYRYLEEIKLTQAVKLNPDTLIFGNSRAEVGFDPESEALIRRGFSAYNLAIRGTSIAEASRELEYLLKKGQAPKRIIVALEFVDFMQIGQPKPVRDDFKITEETDFPVERWFWRIDSLFSMASIKDSMRTLAIQRDEQAAINSARGFNPLRGHEAVALNEGYYALFRQRAEENAKTYLKKSTGRLDQSQIKLFSRMLERATSFGSEVTVVIYPYHAQILALFELTGLMPAFIDWKHEVVSEVVDLLNHRADARVSVFDFSGYGKYQCQIIPPKGDLQGVSLWYWEAGHFKKGLGDVMMERIFSDGSDSEFGAHDSNLFGVKLSQANFNSNLERMDNERQHCMEDNPQLFDEVKSLVHDQTRK